MVKVIINEQHSIIKQQKQILKNKFGEYEIVEVPTEGWTVEEIKEKTKKLEGETVVFVSPVPLLIKLLSFISGDEAGQSYLGGTCNNLTKVFIFHNDRREKKELDNGKVIYTVSQTGWKLT